MEQKPIIELKNISYQYHREQVLSDINLTIQKGEFWAVIGPNGSGKSTLLKLMLRLLALQEGSIFLFGQDIRNFDQWEKIGYVSQKANSFNSGFPATVFEVVRSGLTKQTGLFRPYPKNVRERVRKVLEMVGLENMIDRTIGDLSGGQQQRVFIARALINEPEILILDEPTVGLDVERVQAFYDLLSRLNREKGLTIVIVTHDVSIFSEKVTHIAYLQRSLKFKGCAADFNRTGELNHPHLYALEGWAFHKQGIGGEGDA